MKICGLILAAGCSTRAGDFKITRTINEKRVIEYVVDAMSSVCENIIVVTGHMQEKLSYLPDKYDNLSLVFNEHYREGMFSSVLSGLSSLAAHDADYVIICPGDCPAVSHNTYRSLAEKDYGIKVPLYNGRPGHPICIRKDHISILRTGRYATLKEFIKSCGYHEVHVNDPGILMDVDYAEDFKNIADYLRKA